eukprot:1161734-Pelagomonas_calceolata.AAC.20
MGGWPQTRLPTALEEQSTSALYLPFAHCHAANSGWPIADPLVHSSITAENCNALPPFLRSATLPTVGNRLQTRLSNALSLQINAALSPPFYALPRCHQSVSDHRCAWLFHYRVLQRFIFPYSHRHVANNG